MKATDVVRFPKEIIDTIFKEIPLINRAIESEPEERSFFLRSSKIFEVSPGDVIIRKGEFENWIYFLLAGQLLVYPEFADKKKNLVNYISPGEMFGEMAFIRELNRTATIVADENSHKIIFLGTDFSDFGEIDDFSKVSISTKISFYRSAVRINRKRLENLKIDYPDNELVLKPVSHKSFSGEKNSIGELLYLQDQSKNHANLLHKWNRSMEIDTNYNTSKGRIPIDQIKSLLNGY
ncbi:MAG: cyclic nucleotide-binding domain-containing protein [Deltaproteobacteria bacterium]|nr:cyclic nucleotide-binding domain-containing protein [Deltaproteobacteria bacterium]